MGNGKSQVSKIGYLVLQSLCSLFLTLDPLGYRKCIKLSSVVRRV